jgi:hypothetical protein
MVGCWWHWYVIFTVVCCVLGKVADKLALAGAAATITSDALMNPFDGVLSIPCSKQS